MTDQDGRLARHVAEAADAWLRDPLDAGVYRRLVDATLAWRAGGGRVVPGATDGATARPATSPERVGHDPRPDPGPDAPGDTTDDDARYLRPERAPRAVGSTLADVASMLRARAGAAGSTTISTSTRASTDTDTDTDSKTTTETPQERDEHS